ncbi:tagaturonate epimerase family protein [Stieleria sp. TO1_6]|uniref:tagaturonate epimerase family protein n=1 Tax=Stieleria tagensis TaxID=2956795 RepID=UPI00209B59CF|nr:tagaturonate epimerase family protein [Stieleria tagensis]MCO8122465.1 tagaturonate epimerase family protein [Stieleria tagensis]
MNKPSKCVTLGLAPSFGFGDRIGLATPGHVEAMKRSGNGIQPIFPQQSIREMTRTQRTPQQVIDDAYNGARDAGWDGLIGADADHLKTPQDVDVTAAVGFTFFTIDPSDDVDQKADDYDEATLRDKFSGAKQAAPWYDSYLGKSIDLPSGSKIDLSEEACMRAAVKYGPAISRALKLGDYIRSVHESKGLDYEIELSVDETDQPTTLAEHYIIADQCLKGGMKLVSLAPRFIGELEKGVDYKGDVDALEASLNDHAAISELLGPYKLSLHSGSDKLSMYAALARATKGRFHVKTAGTSYLEALRVVARHDEALFRRIVQFGRERYDVDKATYHVSATNAAVPSDEGMDAGQLEKIYLECWADVPQGAGFTEPGRQILHCTFGSTLTDPELGPAVRDVLESHPDTYTEVLADHFSRHLQALAAGM